MLCSKTTSMEGSCMDDVKLSKEENRKRDQYKTTEQCPAKFKIPKISRPAEQQADTSSKNDSTKKYLITLKKKTKNREASSSQKGTKKYKPKPVQKVDASNKYEPTPLPKVDEIKAPKRPESNFSTKSDGSKKNNMPPLPSVDTPAYEPSPVQTLDDANVYEPTRLQTSKKVDPIQRSDVLKKCELPLVEDVDTPAYEPTSIQKIDVSNRYEPSPLQKSDAAKRYEVPPLLVTDVPLYEPTSIKKAHVLNKYDPTPVQKSDVAIAAKKYDPSSSQKSEVTKKHELPQTPNLKTDSSKKCEQVPLLKSDVASALKKHEPPPLPMTDVPIYEPTSIQKIDVLNLYEPTPLHKSDTLKKYEPTKFDKQLDKKSDKKSRKDFKRESRKGDSLKKSESSKKVDGARETADSAMADNLKHEPVQMKDLPLPPLPKEPSPQPIQVLESDNPSVFACSFCTKTFHKKEFLKRHTRYECGLEPMAKDETSCPHCPYKAADKQALKCHISVKHYVPW